MFKPLLSPASLVFPSTAWHDASTCFSSKLGGGFARRRSSNFFWRHVEKKLCTLDHKECENALSHHSRIVPTFRSQYVAKLLAQSLSENRRKGLQLYDCTTLCGNILITFHCRPSRLHMIPSPLPAPSLPSSSPPGTAWFKNVQKSRCCFFFWEIFETYLSSPFFCG